MEWIIVELWLAFLKCSLPSTKESRSMRIYISWSKLGCPRWDIIWECQDKASFFLCCINGWSQNRNVQNITPKRLITKSRLEHYRNIWSSCNNCRQQFGIITFQVVVLMLKRIYGRQELLVVNLIIKFFNIQISRNGMWVDVVAHCLWFVREHFPLLIFFYSI